MIGDFVPYPKGIRGGKQIYNPDVPGNCVINAIAAHKYFLEHSNVKPFHVTLRRHEQGDQFWQRRVKLGNLSTDITW